MDGIILIILLGCCATPYVLPMKSISCWAQLQVPQSKTYRWPVKDNIQASGSASQTPKSRQPHQFPIVRARDGVVARIRCFGVRSTPHEHFVVVNLGVMTMFERKRKVGVELQPRYMGEPVDPSLGIRLRAFYWAHVVGFPVICDVTLQ